MEKMQILFSEPQLHALRHIAKIEDRPVSELIRSAVDFWLSRHSGSPADRVAETPPSYGCGKVQIVAADLRDASQRDDGAE